MFSTMYHAVSVTQHEIVFCCPEIIKTHVHVVTTDTQIEEIEVRDSIRHFNRIQTSGSKKTRIEMGRSIDLRFYHNAGENEHRSKERSVMARR